MKTPCKICPLFSHVYHNIWGRILFSAGIAALTMLLFSKVQTISYLTNDDNAIAFALAGYQTGAPYPYALFINCLLGYLVSMLYTLLPAVPWWPVLQLCVIFLSLTVIGSVLLRLGERQGRSVFLPLMLYGSLLLLCALQPVVLLTYTVTAAFAGAAGVALLVCAVGENIKKRRILNLFGVLALFGSFLWREETGFVMLCFFAVACVYRVLLPLWEQKLMRKLDGQQRQCAVYLRDTAVCFLAVALLCGGAFCLNNAMRARVDGKRYTAFFQYRERFTDYPRDTYAENPELYASVGWDETVYALADNWCFLDERIQADTLKKITEGSTHWTMPSLRTAAMELSTWLHEEPSAWMTVCVLLCLLLAAIYQFLKNGRRNPSALIALLCCLLGGMALCVYLCLSGRFLLRTFQVVAIPAITLSMALFLELPKTQRRIDHVALAIVLGGIMVASLLSGVLQAKELRVNSPKQLLADCRSVHAYVLAHPQDVFVRDTLTFNDIDAFATFPDGKPINLLSWGGCGMRSEAYHRQLAANGITAQYADLFRAENVYFITSAQRTDAGELLLNYLKTVQGASGYARVDTIGSEIAVYKVLY
ncbi:MAG: hypothetical protein RR224_01705 [Clostridia bacterium]